MRIYDTPLIGIASADDPYFNELRKPGIVGPKFILPEEWLPNAKSVISYFLPFTKEIRDSNRKPGLPSEEWVSARIDGENFNNTVRSFLVNLLKKINAEAVAPGIDPRFKVEERISNWSERHVAFTAISEAGKDHNVCSEYIDKEIRSRFAPRYGCAKCNINVPCECKIPTI